MVADGEDLSVGLRQPAGHPGGVGAIAFVSPLAGFEFVVGLAASKPEKDHLIYVNNSAQNLTGREEIRMSRALAEVSPSLSPPTVNQVYNAACAAAYGNPLIENSYRGLVAEIIVGAALGPEWQLCSGGWSGWDLQHMTGCRLEVKQSAARQTWASPKRPATPSFGIPEKTGYYEEGVKWTAQTGRHAHIYVFAYHSVTDESADHREASQWQFHVVATSRLPATKSISLAKLISMSETVPWAGLKIAVERVRSTL